MSDNDLIRRGDALYAIAGWGIPSTAIAALPAVTVGVRPLVWDRYGNAQGYGCKYMIYEVGTGWNAVLYPSDAANYQIATGVPEVEAVAACGNDHRARLLAALDLTPAPDAQAVREADKDDVDLLVKMAVHEALREAIDRLQQAREFEAARIILALIGKEGA